MMTCCTFVNSVINSISHKSFKMLFLNFFVADSKLYNGKSPTTKFMLEELTRGAQKQIGASTIKLFTALIYGFS